MGSPNSQFFVAQCSPEPVPLGALRLDPVLYTNRGYLWAGAYLGTAAGSVASSPCGLVKLALF